MHHIGAQTVGEILAQVAEHGGICPTSILLVSADHAIEVACSMQGQLTAASSKAATASCPRLRSARCCKASASEIKSSVGLQALRLREADALTSHWAGGLTA